MLYRGLRDANMPRSSWSTPAVREPEPPREPVTNPVVTPEPMSIPTGSIFSLPHRSPR